MVTIEAGKTYTAYRQGTAIAPREVQVDVIWVDAAADTVHYHRADDHPGDVKQTSIARFREIITK